jgi:hypothetical protein
VIVTGTGSDVIVAERLLAHALSPIWDQFVDPSSSEAINVVAVAEAVLEKPDILTEQGRENINKALQLVAANRYFTKLEARFAVGAVTANALADKIIEQCHPDGTGKHEERCELACAAARSIPAAIRAQVLGALLMVPQEGFEQIEQRFGDDCAPVLSGVFELPINGALLRQEYDKPYNPA